MEDTLKKSVGLRMRKIRKTLGYTQEKMVSFFNIGRANYSRIEKGEVWPSLQILFTLRSTFNVSLDWLITNSGKMFLQCGQKKVTKKIDFGEYGEEIKDLLLFMDKAPIIKHAVLGFFHEYVIKHQNILNQYLDKNNSTNTSELKANGTE